MLTVVFWLLGMRKDEMKDVVLVGIGDGEDDELQEK